MTVLSSALMLGVAPTEVHAQSVMHLPVLGATVNISPVFMPTTIKGLHIPQDDALNLGFFIDPGNENAEGVALTKTSRRLIKYFLAALTVPEEEQWVNLSPHEKNRIVPESFGMTEMGRDLLAQDYLLKQLTSSLISPEEESGRLFWDRVYEKAYAQFGTTDIPIDALNKIWIVPHKATLYEKQNHVFIVDNTLKVMLESDYLSNAREGLASSRNRARSDLRPSPKEKKFVSMMVKNIISEILLPAVEREINEGQNFALLRQIYNSMLLATWYKRNLQKSLLGQIYADKNKVKGVDLKDKHAKVKIYNRYLEAFQKGVFTILKDEYDFTTQEIIPRKYFSGGTRGYMDFDPRIVSENSHEAEAIETDFINTRGKGIIRVDAAMVSWTLKNETMAQNFKKDNAMSSAVTNQDMINDLQEKLKDPDWMEYPGKSFRGQVELVITHLKRQEAFKHIKKTLGSDSRTERKQFLIDHQEMKAETKVFMAQFNEYFESLHQQYKQSIIREILEISTLEAVMFVEEKILKPYYQNKDLFLVQAEALGSIDNPEVVDYYLDMLIFDEKDIRSSASPILTGIALLTPDIVVEAIAGKWEGWLSESSKQGAEFVNSRIVSVLQAAGTQQAVELMIRAHDRVVPHMFDGRREYIEKRLAEMIKKGNRIALELVTSEKKLAHLAAHWRASDNRILQLLLGALHEADNEESMENALSAIGTYGRYGAKETVPALKKYFEKGSPYARSRVVRALEIIATSEAVDLLKKISDTQHNEVIDRIRHNLTSVEAIKGHVRQSSVDGQWDDFMRENFTDPKEALLYLASQESRVSTNVIAHVKADVALDYSIREFAETLIPNRQTKDSKREVLFKMKIAQDSIDKVPKSKIDYFINQYILADNVYLKEDIAFFLAQNLLVDEVHQFKREMKDIGFHAVLIRQMAFDLFIAFWGFSKEERLALLTQLHQVDDPYYFSLVIRLFASSDIEFISSKKQSLLDLIYLFTDETKIATKSVSFRFGSRNIVNPVNKDRVKIVKFFDTSADASKDAQGLQVLSRIADFIKDVRILKENPTMVEYTAPWDILMMTVSPQNHLVEKKDKQRDLTRSISGTINEAMALYQAGYVQSEGTLLFHHQGRLTGAGIVSAHIGWSPESWDEITKQGEERELRVPRVSIEPHTNFRGRRGNIVDGGSIIRAQVPLLNKTFNHFMTEVLLAYVLKAKRNRFTDEELVNSFLQIKHKRTSVLGPEEEHPWIGDYFWILPLSRKLVTDDWTLGAKEYGLMINFIEKKIPRLIGDVSEASISGQTQGEVKSLIVRPGLEPEYPSEGSGIILPGDEKWVLPSSIDKPESGANQRAQTPQNKKKFVKGGIDFNPELFDLQVKRDGQGIVLPFSKQPLASLEAIAGFIPVIINISYVNMHQIFH